MTCHDLQHHLFSFLDGMLEERLSEEIRHHLEACPTCNAEVEATKRLEDRLRATVRDEAVPASLWSRIQSDLDRNVATPDTTTVKRPRVRPWAWLPRRRMAWIQTAVAAAVIILALSLALLKPWLLPGSLEARLLSVPVQDLHTFVVSARNLDVASTAPQQVQRWFREKVGFPPPSLPARVGTAQLVGGRLCHFLNRRVAAFMYAAEGHYLSLYVMPRRGLSLPERDRLSLDELSATLHEVQGYTHILWSRTDLIYSLVSDLPQTQLMTLARAVVQEG